MANAVVAPVSDDGTVCFYSSIGTDFLVDVAGAAPTQSLSSPNSANQTTAHDAVLARVYGPQQAERSPLNRQRLAWWYAPAQRYRSSQKDEEPQESGLAIDLLLSTDQL